MTSMLQSPSNDCDIVSTVRQIKAIASEKLQRLSETPALRITAEDVRLWQRLHRRMTIYPGEADLARG